MPRVLFIILMFCSSLVYSQEQEEQKNWDLNGYVKFLETLTFLDGADETFTDQLIHNRLNFKWYIDEQWTFTTEARNRVFWGSQFKLNPLFEEQVEMGSNDLVDLSFSVLDNDDILFHTAFDRMNIQYTDEHWDIKVGRQRVNWGINTIWNPNDVFNAYSFTDFDYEERPGSDAVRVQYNYSFSSGIEFVSSIFEDIDDATIAAMWRFNKGTYDFQLISGYTREDWFLGGGWAGNLGNWGFKGEVNYFFDTSDDNAFVATVGADYTLNNGMYLNFGALYNQNGSSNAQILNLFNFELSSKNLYPYKFSIITQVSGTITPLIAASLAIIYSPASSHPTFINPGFTISLATNFDFDLLGQLVFNKTDRYYSPIQVLFGRVKYSF